MSARADVSPPSRIIDFKMTGTTDDSLYIRLEWSAPGDDYDRGRGKYCYLAINCTNIIDNSWCIKYFRIFQNIL